MTQAAITLTQIINAGVHPTQARTIIEPLIAACARFDIDSPARRGAFVGQCMVESALFTTFEENCTWTTPERIMRFFPMRVTSIAQAMTLVRNPKALANAVYAGKNGNGNPLSGDGWNYRGRGAIDLSGKNNYSDAETELGRPYVAQPDLVAQPEDALLTGAWFWHVNKLNLLADGGNLDAITRVVNGPGMSDRALRRQFSEQAIHAFGMS